VYLLGRFSLLLLKLSVICFLVAEFKKDEYTVGRDVSCGLVINDSHLNKTELSLVSKKQFKISHKKDFVYLEGYALTYVNYKKIGPAEKSILKHSDFIAIGKQDLKGRKCCEVDVHKEQWISTSLACLPLTSKFIPSFILLFSVYPYTCKTMNVKIAKNIKYTIVQHTMLSH
jgi:pSer/pThr/pTyr-binding forkhead associated (FHA) protein